MLEVPNKWRQCLYILSVDFEMAFDSVDRQTLWRANVKLELNICGLLEIIVVTLSLIVLRCTPVNSYQSNWRTFVKIITSINKLCVN